MDRRLFLCTVTLILAACATTQGTGPRRSSRVLLADEIAEVSVMSAYQAVERLRPQWLHSRASPTMANPEGAEPLVYVDGMRAGNLSELLQIRPERVERMEYLNPSDATNRFGTDHTAGAILVVTRSD
ncbi:MAG: hypothetical protein P8170_18665 [Gemmatimonadota bacterium]|jgi:hypothetical protein